MRIPSYFAGSGSPELAPAARCVSIASVRNPWAIVPPNGVAAARSGSTWMNWWSWVTSANWFTWSWVASNHSPVPSSLPTSAWNRGNAFSAAALMPRTLGGGLVGCRPIAVGHSGPPATALSIHAHVYRREHDGQDRTIAAAPDAIAGA